MRAYFCQCMKIVWKSFSWEVFDLFYVYMLKCVFLTTRENVDKDCLMKTTLSGQSNNFQTTYSKIKTKNIFTICKSILYTKIQVTLKRFNLTFKREQSKSWKKNSMLLFSQVHFGPEADYKWKIKWRKSSHRMKHSTYMLI